MGNDRTIKEAIQQLAGTGRADTIYTLDAIVESVDEGARSCVCKAVSGKASFKIPDVRIMSSLDDGVLIIPAVGSNVCIILSNFTKPYVSQYSEVDKIVFRGGDLGGLIKVKELTDQLNSAEQKINDLITMFNNHVHTGNGFATVTKVIGSLPKTQRDDLENKQVTHG